jgi:microcystin-dependent protein
MADQLVGEISVFPFNFAPTGWAMCNGQVMAISQNTALFSLLGTQFGGNGTSTFALPNLQGSVPLDAGFGPGLSQRVIGEVGGSPTVTLTVSEIPAHSHSVVCAAGSNATSPANAAFGGEGRGKPPAYAPSSGTKVNMSSSAVAHTGGGLPHDNMQPYLVLNFCIALQGIFPARA